MILKILTHINSRKQINNIYIHRDLHREKIAILHLDISPWKSTINKRKFICEKKEQYASSIYPISINTFYLNYCFFVFLVVGENANILGYITFRYNDSSNGFFSSRICYKSEKQYYRFFFLMAILVFFLFLLPITNSIVRQMFFCLLNAANTYDMSREYKHAYHHRHIFFLFFL
jgi:hypothetical protein